MLNATLLVSNVAKETGALLHEYLKKRDINSYSNSIGSPTICYGVPCQDRQRVLNRNCGLDKISRMEIMDEAGVSVIPWFQETPKHRIQFPLLARKRQGHGGTDIVPVFAKEEIEWRRKAGWDWFSIYIHPAREYRVWVCQNKILDTYQKLMVRPQEYAYIGRNFRNGFDFSLCNEEKNASIEAKEAVRALNLDFAAVDILQDEAGTVYVLEVNTAPGVIKSGAQKTLGKLADCMAAWVKDA